MRVGVFLGDQPFGSDDPDVFAGIAALAERCGFDAVWLGDHPVRPALEPSTYPYAASGRPMARAQDSLFDPIVTLTHMASATSAIALGTAVYVLPYRHPLVVAREVMCLDRIAKGRFVFGVGGGWFEEEFQALGLPFALRGRMFDDGVELVRRLWVEDGPIESHSEVYPFGPVLFRPKPVQRPGRPHPPILVGGQTGVAIRRAARIGDGWIPVAPPLDELARMLGRLDEALAAAGRSRAGFTVEVRTPALPTLADLAGYEELGIDGVRIHAAHLAGVAYEDCTPADAFAGVERFAETVLSRR